MADYRFRQQGILSDRQAQTEAVVVGAGGIGSSTALALAKMGVKRLHVFDFDLLEEHNIGNQFLPANFMGRKKIDALKFLIDILAPDNAAQYYDEEYVDQLYAPFLIMGVDSMRARNAIFTAARMNNFDGWLIDGRMGAQVLEVHTVDMSNENRVDEYSKTLWSDAEVSPEPCTARGIVYTSMFAGAHIAHQVREILTDGLVPNTVTHLIVNDVILRQ